MSLQLHEVLARSFAWCWTEPKQKIIFVALCNRDNGMDNFSSFLSRQIFKYEIWFVCDFTTYNTVAHQLTLQAIHESFPELLFFNSLRKRTKSDDTQSRESTACLAYLLFVQLITIDSFPAVFRWDGISNIWSASLQTKQHLLVSICCSPVFVLQCNMEHISLLLSRSGNEIILNAFFFFPPNNFTITFFFNSKKESQVLKGMVRMDHTNPDRHDIFLMVITV